MSKNYLSLPSEVRNDIYERLLVLDAPLECVADRWRWEVQVQSLTFGVLLANKAIHREASSLLYAQNSFNLAGCTDEDISSFFEKIGPNNATCIRHIYIDFPDFDNLDPQDPPDITLENESVRILEHIRDHCSRLNKITTTLRSTNAAELRLDALDCPKVITEAIALVNNRFRAILSLQEIVVEVYEDGPSDQIRREMKSHGWTIRELEYVEDSCHGWSDDDLRHYDYSCNEADYDDDYDIDNDSDFWRRAGD